MQMLDGRVDRYVSSNDINSALQTATLIGPEGQYSTIDTNNVGALPSSHAFSVYVRQWIPSAQTEGVLQNIQTFMINEMNVKGKVSTLGSRVSRRCCCCCLH